MGQRVLFGVLMIAVALWRSTCAFSWAQSATPQRSTIPFQSAPSAAPGPTVETKALQTAIPAANIASEAEAANLRLRHIRLDLDEAVKLSGVERQLDVLTVSLQRIRPALETEDNLRVEELFNFRQELARFGLVLKDLQNELIPRSRVLEERREELGGMELLWKATLRSLSGQEVPASSRELIHSTQRRIDETITLLRTDRPVLLTIQNRVSEQRILVSTLLAQANDALERSRARLLTAESDPLWTALHSAEVSASVAESIRLSYSRRALLLDYLKDNKWRLWAHLFVSAFLIWFLTVVSRGSRKWLMQTREDQASEEVLRHPLEGALVVSLLLSFIVYPNAPLVLYRMPLVLMIFPLGRIVSGALSRNERATFYFLTGLYLLWRLDGLFSSIDLVFRVFTLVVAGLGLFGALWRVRAIRAEVQAGAGPWTRARLQVLRVGAVVLLGSLIANILGSAALAALLAGACIGSAYAGAAIFAGVMILEGYILPLFQSPLAQRSLSVRERGGKFRRHCSLLIRFGALSAWAGATLVFFGVNEPVLKWLSSTLARKWSFDQITFSIGGILLFMVTIGVSVWAARFVAFVCEKDILSRLKLPRGIPATVSMLVRDCIVALGFIVALAGAGVRWSQIVLVASAIGVGIGFGLQQLVASFFAGLILIFERPIRLGDVVELGKYVGVVSRIGLRSSTIRVDNGSDVICPNSRIISEDLVNWTLSNQLRQVEVEVRVVRESDPETVLAVLKRAAGGHTGALHKPDPVALFKGFGESSLIFVLRFFASIDAWAAMNSEVGIRINKELREAGIEIALPERGIRITGENIADPTATKAVLSAES